MAVTFEQLIPFTKERSSVHRLQLDPTTPLYPVSAGRLDPKSKKPVAPGVYEVGSWERRWLIVEPDAVRAVTEAEMVIALGAVGALEALGLGDAAISLITGDLTNARYQWLRHREGK
jgi:hypothetical protein